MKLRVIFTDWFTKKRRERMQINKILKKRGDIIADITQIQRIKNDYYEVFYIDKSDNLEKWLNS